MLFSKRIPLQAYEIIWDIPAPSEWRQIGETDPLKRSWYTFNSGISEYDIINVPDGIVIDPFEL